MLFSFLSCYTIIKDGETLRDPPAIYLHQSLLAEDIRTQIIETSPGGADLAFVNKKTGESTGYTPQGMTAEEIFTIPGAERSWGSIELVKEHMERKNADREIYGEEGLVSSREI